MAKDVSPLQRLKQLDDEKNKILAAAKDEAMSLINQGLTALRGLGFNYKVSESSGRASRKGTRTVRDVPCPICGFKTKPPHDRRAHRSQGDNKKPFTAQELNAKGLQKA
jgi:hypothetical protein